MLRVRVAQGAQEWRCLYGCACMMCGIPLKRRSLYNTDGVEDVPTNLLVFAAFTWCPDPEYPQHWRGGRCKGCGGRVQSSIERHNDPATLALLPRFIIHAGAPLIPPAPQSGGRARAQPHDAAPQPPPQQQSARALQLRQPEATPPVSTRSSADEGRDARSSSSPLSPPRRKRNRRQSPEHKQHRHDKKQKGRR